jgi:protein ImuA
VKRAVPVSVDASSHHSGRFGIEAIDERIGTGAQHSNLHEVRCSQAREFACAAGFALGFVRQFAKSSLNRILWILDPASGVEAGQLFPDGLRQFGFEPDAFTFVRPITLQDALWAADQAAMCGGIDVMFFQIRGHPKRFDLTATRRLMIRARKSGVLVCVLRQSGGAEASAAITRWHVEADTSGIPPDISHGIGPARYVVTLERNRNGRTGKWKVIWNPSVKVFEDGTSSAGSTYSVSRVHEFADGSDCPDKMGQILDFEWAS